MEKNCRVQFAQNIVSDGKKYDLFTIDAFNNNEWYELTLPFTPEERESEMYLKLKRLCDLASK